MAEPQEYVAEKGYDQTGEPPARVNDKPVVHHEKAAAACPLCNRIEPHSHE